MNLLVFVICLLVCIIAIIGLYKCTDGDCLIEVIMEWRVCC